MPATSTRFASTLGDLVLTASDMGLTGVSFPTSRHGPPVVPPLRIAERGSGGEVPIAERGSGGEVRQEDEGHSAASELLAHARRQLTEYFARTRTTFELPLDPAGTTFQREVWDLLRTIPYGTT